MLKLFISLSVIALTLGAESGSLDDQIDAALARDNPTAIAEDAPKVI